MVQHASRSGSVPPLTRSSFISAWRAADLRRATALKNRGLLPAGQIAQQDPICQNCGHRAIVHGMQNLPVKDRGRWWRKSSTPCGWRSCQCTDWEPELSARSGADFSCEVRITEAWIEVPLGHSWIVAYRIMNERGTPVLGELRVFPAEDGDERPLGQWSGELLGANAKVPSGGITSRQLRGIRVRAYLSEMAKHVAKLRIEEPEVARMFGWGRAADELDRRPPSTGRRGRKGRPDSFYVEIAREYTEANSHHPVADVARRRRLPPGQVRDMVREARKRGLLSRSGRSGVRGGVLTDRALEISKMITTSRSLAGFSPAVARSRAGSERSAARVRACRPPGGGPRRAAAGGAGRRRQRRRRAQP